MTIGSKDTRDYPRGSLSKLKLIVSSKWFLGSAVFGGFVYAVVRALIASPAFGLYGVNVWIFLLIDVATVPPYVLFINRTIKRFFVASWHENVLNGFGIGLSFMAPYIYVFISGGPVMQGWVIATFVLIIIVFAALGPIRTIMRRLK